MAGQYLLTIFTALTALAVVIQTGILTGFYIMSSKLGRRTEQTLETVHGLLGPLQTTLDSLHSITERISTLSAETEQRLRRLGDIWTRAA